MIWIEALNHFLHLTAAIVWFGGMAYIVLILSPALEHEPSSGAPNIRPGALGRRYQAVEGVCVAVLLATGAYKLAAMGPPLGQIFMGSFGKILEAKLILVAIMLYLSFMRSVVWAPRSWELPPESAEAKQLHRQIAFWARVSLALGVGVVAASAFLHVNPF